MPAPGSEHAGRWSLSGDELRAAVQRGNADLGKSGLVVLSFGNLSAIDRSSRLVAIKPSGMPYAELRPEDIPLVDVDTGEVRQGTTRPSSDLPTHLELYRAFESIGAVVHTHSLHATAWAQAGRDLPCLGTTHADHVRGPVPVTRPLTDEEIAGDYERLTGRAIVERLTGDGRSAEDVTAVLVASHGPFAWGPTIAAALANAIALEHAAAIAIVQAAIGPSTPIPPALLERHFGRKHGPAAYYGQPPAADDGAGSRRRG